MNQISTGGDSFDSVVTVISKFGKRSGSSSTNQLDDDGLKAAVQMSERVAKLSPEDPEAMPELGPQTYQHGVNWSDATASLDPATRAHAVKRIADPAKAADLVSTGFMEAITGAQAIANNKGLFAYNRSTSSVLTTTVRTPDGTGSGWAGAHASRLEPHRSRGARRARHAKGAHVGESRRDRAGSLHRRVRADRRRQSRAVHHARAQRARRRRRPFVLLAAGRKEQDRTEGRRRTRDDRLRSVRSRCCRRRRSAVTDCRRNASYGSRTAS